jgi:hypothetical protein
MLFDNPFDYSVVPWKERLLFFYGTICMACFLIAGLVIFFGGVVTLFMSEYTFENCLAIMSGGVILICIPILLPHPGRIERLMNKYHHGSTL